ncbi:hypothetical protein V6N13_051164 [Hibiscus sabdariffa]
MGAPQALQLKLYQAFIFSIPILFLLFYLKRRASYLAHSPHGLSTELTDKVATVLFDEELRTRDSQCCVPVTKIHTPISEIIIDRQPLSSPHQQNGSSEPQQSPPHIYMVA